MTTTVVIVDDHPIVRAGMRAILQSAADIEIVGEGENGADALRLVDELRPDVLALDVQLPDPSPGSGQALNGLEVTRQLRAKGAATAVLILTVHNDPQTIFGLLESGAVGYVLKDEALETLVSAVRSAARGETWLSPAVARQVVRRAVEKVVPDFRSLEDFGSLTPREVEVLRLIARGLDNTAIAQELCLTKRTVQNHISNIYGKLGVASRTEAALLALHHGLGAASSEGGA
jgi:DNA-binding NarL/FixJ family response regulator